MALSDRASLAFSSFNIWENLQFRVHSLISAVPVWLLAYHHRDVTQNNTVN